MDERTAYKQPRVPHTTQVPDKPRSRRAGGDATFSARTQPMPSGPASAQLRFQSPDAFRLQIELVAPPFCGVLRLPPPAAAPGPAVAGWGTEPGPDGSGHSCPDRGYGSARPGHGTLLPVQTRNLQNQFADGSVVGRQALRPALFQDAGLPTDGQPGPVHFQPSQQDQDARWARPRCVGTCRRWPGGPDARSAGGPAGWSAQLANQRPVGVGGPVRTPPPATRSGRHSSRCRSNSRTGGGKTVPEDRPIARITRRMRIRSQINEIATVRSRTEH